MSFRKVWQLIALITILAMAIGACSSGQTSTTAPSSESPAAVVEPAKAPLKVALLTTGPLADSGWNATAYQGLLDAQKEFGIEPAVSEDVPAPDREQTIRDYASQGYSLIIGHDFSFMDPMVKISPEYPDTYFSDTTGYTGTVNMASYYMYEVQSHYLAGIILGSMTKSNVIGVVGGVDLPTQDANFNALKAGVASVNPDAKVLISFVGSWGDPAGGKEAALAQINSGADIILDAGAASGLGTLEAVAEKNIPVISFIPLDSETAPKQMIASILPDYEKMVRDQVALVVNGQFKGGVVRPDLASGIIQISMNDGVPADVQALVEKAKQDIIDGKLVIEENFNK
jgi:basic membrane protein A and related proteins